MTGAMLLDPQPRADDPQHDAGRRSGPRAKEKEMRLIGMALAALAFGAAAGAASAAALLDSLAHWAETTAGRKR